ELAAERDKPIELLARGSGVDRACGQLDALREVARPGPGDQRRGGVHQHDVPARPALAAHDGADDLRVLVAVAAPEIADAGLRQAEVLGAHREGADDALAYLGDTALPRVRDLVETVGAVDDERAKRPELGEDPREGFRE